LANTVHSAVEKICNAVNLQHMLIYSNLKYQNPKNFWTKSQHMYTKRLCKSYWT